MSPFGAGLPNGHSLTSQATSLPVSTAPVAFKGQIILQEYKNYENYFVRKGYYNRSA